MLAALGVAGAALAAAAAALTWWSADYLDPLTGALTVTATGSTCVPELIPLALVALAGLGATLATHGVLRRVVGLVLLLCGVAVGLRSALSFGSPPTALAGSLSRPAETVGVAQLHPLGPITGLLAGTLLAAAGVLIVLGIGARRGLGARYDAPTRAPSAISPVGAVADVRADDPADWWKALDAGADPTVSDPTVEHAIGGTPTTADTGSPGPAAHSTPDSANNHLPPVSDQTSSGGYHEPNATRPP
jgi:uncharacterized membrane protein (TIGR02234 family)